MPTLITYAWLATVVVTIAVAARRGDPILNAFGWIDSGRGFYFSATVLAVVSGLAVLLTFPQYRPSLCETIGVHGSAALP